MGTRDTGSTVQKVKTGLANNVEGPTRQSGRSLLEKARGYKNYYNYANVANRPHTPYQVVIVCGVFFLFVGLAALSG